MTVTAPRPYVMPMDCDPATVDDGLAGVAVGDKILFDGEGKPYTVRAVSYDRRWIVCTKPFNLRQTVMYCVCDRRQQRRGPTTSWADGFTTDTQISEVLQRLAAGDTEISTRRAAELLPIAVNGQPITNPTRAQAAVG